MVSLDGNREIHDMHRIDAEGRGTFDRVFQTAKSMDKYKVDYNVLSVITKSSARKPEKFFKEYLKNRFKYIQYIPCLTPFNYDEKDKFDLEPKQYAEFLIENFRQWKHQLEVGNYISIRLFDNLVALLKGYPATQCGMLGHCSMQRVIEANGDVYPCDFYVLDKYKCGNIYDMSFEDIEKSDTAKNFLKDMPLKNICRNCKVLSICGGGCKRYRDFYHEIENYCPYQEFLYTVYNELREVAQRLS